MEGAEETFPREAKNPLVHSLLEPARPLEQSIAADRPLGPDVETPRVDLRYRVADPQAVVAARLEPELLTLSRVGRQVVRDRIGHGPLSSLARPIVPTTPARYMPVLVESGEEKP